MKRVECVIPRNLDSPPDSRLYPQDNLKLINFRVLPGLHFVCAVTASLLASLHFHRVPPRPSLAAAVQLPPQDLSSGSRNSHPSNGTQPRVAFPSTYQGQ